MIVNNSIIKKLKEAIDLVDWDSINYTVNGNFDNPDTITYAVEPGSEDTNEVPYVAFEIKMMDNLDIAISPDDIKDLLDDYIGNIPRSDEVEIDSDSNMDNQRVIKAKWIKWSNVIPEESGNNEEPIDEDMSESVSSSKKEYVEPAKEEDVDPEELSLGIHIEMEHTDDPEEAKVIALQHLAELPDYYTRLKKMEDDAKPKESLKKRFKAFKHGYEQDDNVPDMVFGVESDEGTKYMDLYELKAFLKDKLSVDTDKPASLSDIMGLDQSDIYGVYDNDQGYTIFIAD